jgi:HlyD family secretion protein
VAPVAGKVVELSVAGGSTLVPGLPALVIQPEPVHVTAVALASPNAHAQIYRGQPVTLAAASAPPAQYGSIEGRITRISDTPATLSRLDRLTGGNEDLARALLASGPVYEVDVRLKRDPSTVTGYRWTTDEGPDYRVPAGTLVSMVAIVRHESIAASLFR